RRYKRSAEELLIGYFTIPTFCSNCGQTLTRPESSRWRFYSVARCQGHGRRPAGRPATFPVILIMEMFPPEPSLCFFACFRFFSCFSEPLAVYHRGDGEREQGATQRNNR